MTLVKSITYTAATLTLGSTLLWIYIAWGRVKLRRKYRARHIEYVTFPNMFAQALGGKHFELEEYERVQKYGKVFATTIFGQDTIFVSEPELAQLVLSKEFTSFTNRRVFNFNDSIFSAFLSVVQDEQWKRLRSIVTPTFSTGKLRRMKPRIDDTVENLMKNFANAIQSSANVNVKQMYGAFTMDTIMQVAFGTKVDSLVEKDNPIIQMAKKLFSNDMSILNIIKFTIIMFLPRLAKVVNLTNDVMDFFKDFSLKIINEKREKLRKDANNLGKANNFLELLLEAEAESENLGKSEGEANGVEVNGVGDKAKAVKFMTNDELIAQCILFFIAAYDTTTSTISLASYFLALNPSIQDRLYEEIKDNIEKLQHESSDQSNDPAKLITFESLSQFEYLNAVINETLRVYPPASIERTASQDMKLETPDGTLSVELKKGDIVHFPTYAMHRDSVHFADPERFDPDRFMGEPAFHKYAYLPFGSGPRNCVARSLALLEAKMALLNVVYRYRLSPCEQTKIPVEFYNNGSILSPKEVFLKLEKRI